MILGNQFVAIGPTLVFAAIVFEYFGYRLSELAVGFVFVVVGFLFLIGAATSDGTSS